MQRTHLSNTWPRASIGVATLALVMGCGDYDAAVPGHDAPPSSQPGPDATSPLTTWHEHIRPLVEVHCASCHSVGGIAPMPLDTFAATSAFRAGMVASVLGEVGAAPMPPWPMDPACRDVKDARVLTAAQRLRFEAWRDWGFPEGDEADYVPAAPPQRPDLGAPARTLTRTDAYTPSRVSPDDYRCFLFPDKVTADTWITAVDIVPDKPEVVHHVLLFVVPAADVSKIKNLDDASPSVPGYPCVGGSGSSNDQLLAGWVPGMQPIVFPNGSAFPVRQGSRFVAQMHYNTTNIPNGGVVPADATGANLWTLTQGQEPLREVRIRPVADVDLAIAKGQANAVEGVSIRTPYSETAVGVIPHMHLLGKSFGLEVERPGNPSRTCLADIPTWDFHWQQTYMFADEAQVDLHLGDKLHLECIYDNSAANQAIVDGVRRPSQAVGWGEGTFDEMCLAYVVTTTPIYRDGGDALCDGFTTCFEAECANTPADALCPLDCLSWAGLECAQCAFLPLYKDCALEAKCDTQLALMAACLARCPEGQDQIECALGTCADDFSRLHICVVPAIAAGSCDDEAAECGIAYTPQ